MKFDRLRNRLRNRLHRQKRLWAFHDVLQTRLDHPKKTPSAYNRSTSRAAIRLIRLKGGRPPFKAWAGDDPRLILLLKLAELAADVRASIAPSVKS